MIVAVELARDGDRAQPFAWRSGAACASTGTACEHEALLRPIGNVVYFMPPYVITPERDRRAWWRRRATASRRPHATDPRLRRPAAARRTRDVRAARGGGLPRRPRAAAARGRAARRCSTAAAATTACEILAVEGDGVRVRVGDRVAGPARVAARASRWCRPCRAANAWTGRCRRRPSSACARIVPVLSARSVVRLDEQAGREEAAALAGHRRRRLRAVRPQRAARGPARRSSCRATSPTSPREGQRLRAEPDGPGVAGGPRQRRRRASSC